MLWLDVFTFRFLLSFNHFYEVTVAYQFENATLTHNNIELQ